MKRSLITGVPLNMRPRYKDFTLLAIVKGTHGKMSCHEIEMCWGGGGSPVVPFKQLSGSGHIGEIL